MSGFVVDPDELDATVIAMQRCEVAFVQVAVDLERTLADLRPLWSGEAAEAHRAARAEWQHGLAAMRAALATYRLSARSAHEHYLDAAGTNARMWAQTR
jgi:ESAT-6 family protein